MVPKQVELWKDTQAHGARYFDLTKAFAVDNKFGVCTYEYLHV